MTFIRMKLGLMLLMAILGVNLHAQETTRHRRESKDGEDPRRKDETLPPGAVARLGQLKLRHGSGITAVAFAPSSRSVATSGGQVIRLWDTTNGKELRAFEGHKDTVYDLAFSPDGKRLASAGMDKSIRIWDVARGKTVRTLRTPTDGARCVAFAPDGATLASGTWNGTVQLWDANSGEELHRFHKNDMQVIAAITFSPDGKTLAFTAHSLFSPGTPNAPPLQDASNTLHLWDVAAWKEQRRWQTSGDGELSLAFAPDGKLLASAGKGVRLWRTASGEEVRRLEGTGERAELAAFSADGKTLAAGGEKSAGLWSVDSGKMVRRLDIEAQKFAFSPDGRLLATVNDGTTLCLWDAASGKKLLPTDTPRQPVHHLAWARDGKTLASAGWHTRLCVWDVAAGVEVGRAMIAPITAGGGVFFLDDNSLIVTGEGGEVVRFASLRKKLRPLPGLPKNVVSFAVSADGKTLAVADSEGNLRVLDRASGKRVREFTCPREAEQGKPLASSPSLTLSSDGRILAFAAEPRHPLRLWNVATGTPLPSIERLVDFRRELRFSPDGRTIAGWHENALRLCETATGQERWRIGAEYGIVCAAWSPDGGVFATGGRDAVVRFWDLAAGKESHHLSGHRGEVTSLAFSPDGTRLASGSVDTTILIWDAAALLPRRPKTERTPSDADLAECWTDLSGRDAARAYRALQTLTTTPRAALALLKHHLRPAPAVDPRIARLLADLDSDNFKDRERASRELAQQGEAARTALRDVLDARPSLEVRRRAEGLLAKMGETSLPIAVLREVRALEVLEQIGTSEAAGQLRRLAEGAPEARLTREAKAALSRLSRRPF